MKHLIVIIFITILGTSMSQELFYVSVDTYMKMSFNSTNPFSWDDKNAKVSQLFDYKQNSYDMSDPFRIGLSLGFNINSKHTIELGGHFDGVSLKSEFRFASYQPNVGYTTPGRVLNKSRSQQNRFFFNYKYKFVSIPNKTNLSILSSISMVTRAGPEGVEDVGSFGTEGLLIKDSLNYFSKSTSYTAFSNKSFQLGIGFSSDIFMKKKYWFSIHAQYVYSKSYLSYDVDVFSIREVNSGKVEKYVFTSYNRASGLYISVSRKFQLIPWKSKSKSS